MSTEKFAFLMGAKGYSQHLETAAIRWGIVNGRDKARWLAQLYVESDGFSHVEELTRYSAAGLVRTFGSRNGLNPDTAHSLHREGPRAMMNFVYGGEWGRRNLGNTEPDDGWCYRGRGLIQTTGRDNYRSTSMGCYGDDRLLDDPDILCTPEGAAHSAAWYWYSRRCNGIEDVRVLTRKINGGLNHLDKRMAETSRAYDVLAFLTA